MPDRGDAEGKGRLANHWRALAVAEIGESHLILTPPLPCQDACFAEGSGRPLVIVADGLGSKPLSHIGADAVVRLVPCYLSGIEEELSRVLDTACLPATESTEWCQAIGRGILRFAAAVLEDLGRQMGHEARAFQCTLLLAIVGEREVFWLQVGDGDLVFQAGDGVLSTVLPPDPGKSADLTLTIRTAQALPTLACGLRPSDGLQGIAAFSDGTGERLVAQESGEVARLIPRFFSALASGTLTRLDILDFLRDRSVWKKTSRDDRCLGLLAKAPAVIPDRHPS